MTTSRSVVASPGRSCVSWIFMIAPLYWNVAEIFNALSAHPCSFPVFPYETCVSADCGHSLHAPQAIGKVRGPDPRLNLSLHVRFEESARRKRIGIPPAMIKTTGALKNCVTGQR